MTTIMCQYALAVTRPNVSRCNAIIPTNQILSVCHIRENVKQSKKRKVTFFDFQNKGKKHISNNMYRRPKVLGLKTILNQICCPLCSH